MDIFTWIGITLTAAILALTIKPYQPVFALLTSLAAGVCLITIGAQTLGQLASGVRVLTDMAGMSSSVYIPVAKAVAIAAAVRISGAICKDAGQNALSVKLEMMGSVAAIVVCLPLFEQLLNLVSGMLE